MQSLLPLLPTDAKSTRAVLFHPHVVTRHKAVWHFFLLFPQSLLVCYSFITMEKKSSLCFSTIILLWHSLKNRMESIC